jgi:hypothetical protein
VLSSRTNEVVPLERPVVARDALRETGRARALVAVLALAACGGGGSKDGVPGGHSVNKTVNFTDRYGATTVTVASAGTTKAIFKDIYGKPIPSPRQRPGDGMRRQATSAARRRPATRTARTRSTSGP